MAYIVMASAATCTNLRGDCASAVAGAATCCGAKRAGTLQCGDSTVPARRPHGECAALAQSLRTHTRAMAASESRRGHLGNRPCEIWGWELEPAAGLHRLAPSLDSDRCRWPAQKRVRAVINMCRRAYRRAMSMCHAPFESSRRGGRFEYRHVFTRAIAMPSAMPRCGQTVYTRIACSRAGLRSVPSACAKGARVEHKCAQACATATAQSRCSSSLCGRCCGATVHESGAHPRHRGRRCPINIAPIINIAPCATVDPKKKHAGSLACASLASGSE